MLWLLTLLLFFLQGVLTPLLSPAPPPDLLLLAALLPLGQLRLWQGVALAYGLGLLQDVAGGGVLGFHALGLAGGVFLAGLVLSPQLSLLRAGWVSQVAALGLAFAGKWVVFAVLLVYLGRGSSLPEVVRVGGLELFLTFAALLLLHPLLKRLTRRRERSFYL